LRRCAGSAGEQAEEGANQAADEEAGLLADVVHEVDESIRQIERTRPNEYLFAVAEPVAVTVGLVRVCSVDRNFVRVR
jgi:hypothetical protein